MSSILLAGDIGGTKTNLALYAAGSDELVPRREQSFPSADYGGLVDLLADFLGPSGETPVSAAVFGIAGPVIDGDVYPTNLPWVVDDGEVRAFLKTSCVRLMNDLETTALGLLHLPASSFEVLNPGTQRRGNRAVIAAGTGLGQAFLLWDGKRFRPSATEGGHVDFAPRTDLEVKLLNHLRGRFHRVSYERVLSGPGLVNIFEFLVHDVGMAVESEILERMKTEDPAAVIGTAGVEGTSPVCVEALNLFISLYGAQAGNLALATMAVGGVYVAGGIVTRIRPRMANGLFMRAFTDKGRSTKLLEETPVSIVLDAKASLVGAAAAARELLP
jgi:glucokinase